MCFSLQLNLLLSLSCYKLAYHYFYYTCWVATISLLTLAVMVLRSWRWDELLRWRFLLEACVAPGWLPVGWVCSTAIRWESRYSLLCKDNISCNNVYIIKTLVFCIHILAVCMTTWSWTYIWWAYGFDLKTGCDTRYHATPFMSSFRCFGMPLTPAAQVGPTQIAPGLHTGCRAPEHFGPPVSSTFSIVLLFWCEVVLKMLPGGCTIPRWTMWWRCTTVGAPMGHAPLPLTLADPPTCGPCGARLHATVVSCSEADLMPDSSRALTGWFRCEAGPLWPVSVRCAKNEIYSFPFPVWFKSDSNF
jgi:hypothetical protein